MEQRDEERSEDMVGGLAGWLKGMVGQIREGSVRQRRTMRVVDSMTIGGKRSLFLVECGGKHFLVGAGANGVQSIVRAEVECVSGAEQCERSGL